MSTAREKLDELAAQLELPLLTMDGYDDCIVGVVHRQDLITVLYDRDKVLAKLECDGDGMSYQEAEEYHSFNQAGAWVGKHTPAFLERLEDDE